MILLRIFNTIIIKKVPWKSISIRELSCRSLNNNTSKYSSNRNYSQKNPQCDAAKPQHDSGSGGGGGGGKIIFTLGALTLAGGATLAYAKYDPNFRDTLVQYVPITDTIIKTIFREEGGSLYGDVKQTILGAITGSDSKHGSIGGAAEPEPKEYKAPPPIVPALEKEVKKTEENYSEIRVESKESPDDEPTVNIGGDPKPTQEEISETDTANLCELEKKICKSAEEAVNAYNKAIFILRSYNQDIEYIVDEAVNQVRPEIWEEIRQKTRSKYECVKRAERKADEATKDINKLKEIISKPEFEADQITKDMIKNNIAKVQDDIEKAKKELDLEQKHGNVTEKYWDRVEKSRKHFSEELEILFPEIDFSKKQMSVSKEELDLFILHAFAHVLFYQKEMAKMETLLQNRINQAVDQAKRGGYEPLSIVQICDAVEQEKRRLTLCFQQQILKLKKEAEADLREKLKIQSQAFCDHLQDAMKIKEEEIERVLTRKYDELLEAERCKFKTQLAIMVGRLKGLDEAIKARNNADASAKQAQVLWSACQSLLRAIRAGCPGVPWKEQMRPLHPELSGVRRAAAPNDELVQVVLEAVPVEAKERGVYPEDALRERFLQVEKVARTVALVPSEGAALPVHILSYIQSLLLVKAASPIPQAELSNEKIDFSLLNTNEILQRARYWLDRGDFVQTLKYMNLLTGAPRCVARQWMNETRILLETQQAANTLMAHAASSGLMYL